MLKILNIIFVVYFAIGTIVMIFGFFLDISYLNELMLTLTIIGLSLRTIIIYYEKKENKDQK